MGGGGYTATTNRGLSEILRCAQDDSGRAAPQCQIHSTGRNDADEQMNPETSRCRFIAHMADLSAFIRINLSQEVRQEAGRSVGPRVVWSGEGTLASPSSCSRERPSLPPAATTKPASPTSSFPSSQSSSSQSCQCRQWPASSPATPARHQ